MILKNVASQGVYLFAYTSTGPDTGDAGITGRIVKDGTAGMAALASGPTEVDATYMPGVYWQPLSQTETNGNALALAWKSTTSGVSIDPIIVLTSGVNLPAVAHASAGGVRDVANVNGVSTTSVTTVSAYIGTTAASTAQTGDAYAIVTGTYSNQNIYTQVGAVGTMATNTYNRIGAAGSGLTALGDARIAHLQADLTATPPTAATITSTLLAGTVETNATVLQVLRACGSVLAGIVSGGGTSSEVFKGIGEASGGTTRVTVTPDASGNRSAVTLNL